MHALEEKLYMASNQLLTTMRHPITHESGTVDERAKDLSSNCCDLKEQP